MAHPQSTTRTPAYRLPAPALFIGPPSATNTPLEHASTAAHPPLPKPTPPADHDPLASSPSPSSHRPTNSTSTSAPSPQQSRTSLAAQTSTLAQTLDEVEAAASAESGGGLGTLSRGAGGGIGVASQGAGSGAQGGWATFFGAAHAEALAELRRAQVGLAGAWGPRAAGSVTGEEEVAGEAEGKKDGVRAEKEGKIKDEAHRVRDDGERDLKSAEERRRKNDAYFAEVKKGVHEVVARLEVVSAAIRRVESRGGEVWEDRSSGVSGL